MARCSDNACTPAALDRFRRVMATLALHGAATIIRHAMAELRRRRRGFVLPGTGAGGA